MPELLLHGRSVTTVFDLLGRDENDMTYALGWGLARHPGLLRRFAERVAPGVAVHDPVVIELQAYASGDRGYTDLEVRAPELHVIVEAKRGWDPPSEAQLRRYEARFGDRPRGVQRAVVLTQNGAEAVVRHLLGAWSPPPPAEAHVMGWSDVVRLARTASKAGPLAARRVAAELATYLAEVADMRDLNSNRVYVVAVSTGEPWAGWPADWGMIDMVERHRRYFFPATGKNWPKSPPNYIAFRYHGRLQSIHHVDGYEILSTPHPHVPAPEATWDFPHYMLILGPPIRPPKATATGRGIFRSGRVWADLDLLLTSDTIAEARAATERRHAETGDADPGSGVEP